jgi:4-amino-4-deoxy-L-arabinose transferase-like glycosyltransferase
LINYRDRRQLREEDVVFVNSVPSVAVILLIALPLFFYKLGGLALVGPDEPRYAQVAREMFERGDWITPTLLGDTWFEKPALLYWLIIPFYHLLGVNEWAARLPNALLATANLLIIYHIARRASGERYGLWCALALATSGLYFGFARAAAFDMTLTFTFTAALSLFHLADTTSDRTLRRWYLYGFYAAVGVSLLAKGLVGVVLIGVITGLYLIITRQWRNILQFYPFTGLLVFLLVAGLWYGPVIARHGWLFIDEFFIQHHFQRYTTNRYHHPGPVYFFVLIILFGVMPWSMLLVGAVVRGLRRFIASPRQELCALSSITGVRNRLMLLAAIWIAVPLLFFSFSTSKLPGYILPVFPALAFFMAVQIERLLERTEMGSNRWLLLATAALLFIVSLALPYFARKEFQVDTISQLLLAFVPFAAAIGLTVACLRRNAWLSILSLVAMSPLIAIAITSLLFPGIENKSSLAPLSRVAAREMRPGEKMIFFNYMQYSPHFYTNGRVVRGIDGEAIRADNPDELALYLAPHESLLCIARKRQLEQITDDPRFEASVIGSQRDLILLRLSLR